jgi:hypothetical protein
MLKHDPVAHGCVEPSGPGPAVILSNVPAGRGPAQAVVEITERLTADAIAINTINSFVLITNYLHYMVVK